MKRRDFLKTGAAVTLAVALPHAALAETETEYVGSLNEAYATAGFDPSGPENFVTVWTADIHYTTGDPESILPRMFSEVHAMDRKPAFFAIVGDLINSASLQFGQVPDEQQKRKAIEEFSQVRAHLEAHAGDIPVKLALGNHDTHPDEDAPELFHVVFPDHPEYHAFDVGGAHFIFLNGGSSGYLDAKQTDWFCREVEDRHRPGDTLVITCHQPSLGSVTQEWGISRSLRRALDDTQGELWYVGGHHHCNQDTCFRLSNSVITQAKITTGNGGTWGTEHPGYWIYGFSNGTLAARIYRRMDEGYRVASPPPADSARPLLLPFEGQTGVLWSVLVSEGDAPYLVDAQAARCHGFWHYTKSLTYRFPLDLAEGKARGVALLETPVGKEPRGYFLSANGTDWEAVEPDLRDGAFTQFVLPRSCLEANQVYVRVRQCTVSGFALTA